MSIKNKIERIGRYLDIKTLRKLERERDSLGAAIKSKGLGYLVRASKNYEKKGAGWLRNAGFLSELVGDYKRAISLYTKCRELNSLYRVYRIIGDLEKSQRILEIQHTPLPKLPDEIRLEEK